VGDEQDGGAALVTDPAEQGEDLLLSDDIESTGGLVGHNEAGGMQKSEGNEESLALSPLSWPLRNWRKLSSAGRLTRASSSAMAVSASDCGLCARQASEIKVRIRKAGFRLVVGLCGT